MPNGHDDGSYRFSFPVGFPIVVYPILAIGVASGKWWSMWLAVVAVLLAALFTWQAMNRKDFEKMRERDPSLNIGTWRFNWGAFFALPGYAIGLYGWLTH